MNETRQAPMDIRSRQAPPPDPRAQSLGSLPRVLDIPLPWIERIADSQDFVGSGSVDTVAVETGTAITNCSFRLGQGNIGVLRSVTFYVNNMLASTNLVFTIKVNGGPVPGYGAFTPFPRVAASISNGFDMQFLLPSESKIEVFFNNVDGGSYKVGAVFTGWQHPESSALRWMQFGPGR